MRSDGGWASLTGTNKFFSTSLRQIERSGSVTWSGGCVRDKGEMQARRRWTDRFARQRVGHSRWRSTKRRVQKVSIREAVPLAQVISSWITQLKRLFNALVAAHSSLLVLLLTGYYHFAAYFYGASSEGAAISPREGRGRKRRSGIGIMTCRGCR